MSQTTTTRAPAHTPVQESSVKTLDDLTDEQIEALPMDEFADKLIARMKPQEALLTCEDMDEIEAMWERDKRNRRCTLALLTKPWEWLDQKISKDREFAVIVAQIKQYAEEEKFYKGMAELLGTAHVWAMVALSGREDMKEVIAEAKAQWGEA
jgi:hypothetical protein